jgi:hypothetical protein
MKSSSSKLEDLLAGVTRSSDRQEERDTQEKRQNLLALWSKDPWAYLTGRDVDGKRPIVWTKDEVDRQAPLKPFPGHLVYLKRLVKLLQNEQLILIDKARQMYISTVVLLFNDWECAFRQVVNTVLSKTKESEAIAMMRDKVRFPYSQLPAWVRAVRPIRAMPATRIDYPETGSMTLAVAENVAVSEARGRTASRAIVDEAAYHDMFGEIVQALEPMGGQIIAISSPNLGCPGAQVFWELLDREAS